MWVMPEAKTVSEVLKVFTASPLDPLTSLLLGLLSRDERIIER